MSAGAYDLAVESGATCLQVFTWTTAAGVAIDLTGYTAHAQIRDNYAPVGLTLLDLTVGSGITLGGVAGTITMTITAAQTLLLPRWAVWDLKLTAPDGTVTRLLQGKMLNAPEATV